MLFKIPVRAYLSSGLTILTCSLVNMEILSCFLPSEAIAQTWLLAQSSGTNYGLGLPKSASTGGGTRLVNPEEADQGLNSPSPSPEESSRGIRSAPRSAPRSRKMRPLLLLKPQLPLLTLLTPEDGARTASSQPTLYWYISEHTQSSSSAIDNLSTSPPENRKHFVGQLQITTLEEREPTPIFQTDLKMDSGLSSFKLPIAASLKPSKNYRWQITVQDRQNKDVAASGWIVYTPPDDSLKKSLIRALTDRDRAKIYAQAGYWFEAIDGYTRWLNFKPNDLNSETARNEILKAGMAANQKLDFDAFIQLLNADKTKQPVNQPL